MGLAFVLAEDVVANEMKVPEKCTPTDFAQF
jgi:hypothetical protein